jgi:hypothetical protein
MTISRLLRIAPSVIIAITCAAVVFGYLRLVDFDFAQLTAIKAAGLSLLVCVSIFGLVAIISPKLQALNTIVFINVALALAGAELALRLTQDKLPYEIVQMLPSEDRQKLLVQRGLMVGDIMTGDKLLYSWTANATFATLPWLKVDRNGYRNPDVPNDVDVVILGDSVTIAQNSAVDLGDVFRRSGLSALNLGFSGYGPYQYRDSYEKIVIGQDIRHRLVLINFCVCNDVNNSKTYQQVKKLGGDWREYLGTTPTKSAFPFGFTPPWVVSIAFNAPYWIVQQYRNYKSSKRASGSFFIDLPRGNLELVDQVIPLHPQDLSDADWQPTIDALSETIRRAQGLSAKVVLAYYPDLAQLYAPFMPQSAQQRQAAEADYQTALARLAQLAEQTGVAFIDYTPAMRSATAGQLVTSEDTDYHPNRLGVDVMARSTLPVIKEMLAK